VELRRERVGRAGQRRDQKPKPEQPTPS
jgi:hypothetical protein